MLQSREEVVKTWLTKVYTTEQSLQRLHHMEDLQYQLRFISWRSLMSKVPWNLITAPNVTMEVRSLAG